MTSFNKKIKRLYREHGFSGLIEAVIFKFLGKCFNVPSRKIAVFNGIAVRGASFHSKTDIFPEHEGLLNKLPRIPINQKRDSGKVAYLKLWLNGLLPLCVNKLKRVV